jgi:hypothetical protein
VNIVFTTEPWDGEPRSGEKITKGSRAASPGREARTLWVVIFPFTSHDAGGAQGAKILALTSTGRPDIMKSWEYGRRSRHNN